MTAGFGLSLSPTDCALSAGSVNDTYGMVTEAGMAG
jgi:hypothetical protein